MCQSEVARLRKKICEEYEAMRCGFSGFASGTTKHAFIDARMRRVDSCHKQLAKHLGEQEANKIIYDLYTNILG
ncbi:MAG TPA: hypothetical protein VGN34_13180 [Ktedonobacteraceae bacterium]|jgi:hypothetical protein